MPAKRCPTCERDYPAHRGLHRFCLLCGTRLRYVFDGDPMSDAEIERYRRAAKFEAYYDEREQRRIERGDPSPEELGAAEAQMEIRQRKDGDAEQGV